MSLEKQGIKETIEVVGLVAFFVEELFKKALKDGLQLSDAVEVFFEPEFQARAAEALSDIGSVPGEIQDISKIEVLDISDLILQTTRRVVKTIEALKVA